MTIRKKIFLLAGILLALFGAVVTALAIMQTMLSNAIRGAYGRARHYLGKGPQWYGRTAQDYR